MLPAAAAAYLRMSQACEELHLSKGELSELHGLSEIPKDSELLLAALCRLLSRRGTHPSTLLWSSSRSEGVVVAAPGVALHCLQPFLSMVWARRMMMEDIDSFLCSADVLSSTSPPFRDLSCTIRCRRV